jgi:ElaB/YqjD/DUF883 family membrane-anchored ribosome-binding protein
MKNIAMVSEQLKTGISDTLDKAKEISGKIKAHADTTYRRIEHGINRAKTAAEDAVEETRHEIREHPLTAVAIVAGSTFALGLLTGWLITRKTKA